MLEVSTEMYRDPILYMYFIKYIYDKIDIIVGFGCMISYFKAKEQNYI